MLGGIDQYGRQITYLWFALMNRLILDGHAVVLEDDPMLSSDDSYCTTDHDMPCNCRCCFNLQSVDKTTTQNSLDCGCDCDCCQAMEPKLTQYWIDEAHAKTVAEQLVGEKKGLSGAALNDYINE